MPGKLYIVSTPIGNLEDITYRAVSVLNEADLIACEDTRHTKKLLSRFDIHTPLTSYHEHNEKKKSEELFSKLLDGVNIAVVSDAGTPLVSDPGYRICELAIRYDVEVIPVPGSSSVTASLTVSGLPTDSFCFLGFIPRTDKKIRDLLSEISRYKQTLVFYESPKRVEKTLAYLLDVLGDRKAVICREITKLHEETLRGRLSELIEKLSGRETIKGEITLIIEGYGEVKTDRSTVDSDSVRNRLKKLKKMDLSVKDAVKVVNEESDLPKKQIYDMALKVWGK